MHTTIRCSKRTLGKESQTCTGRSTHDECSPRPWRGTTTIATTTAPLIRPDPYSTSAQRGERRDATLEENALGKRHRRARKHRIEHGQRPVRHDHPLGHHHRLHLHSVKLLSLTHYASLPACNNTALVALKEDTMPRSNGAGAGDEIR